MKLQAIESYISIFIINFVKILIAFLLRISRKWYLEHQNPSQC